MNIDLFRKRINNNLITPISFAKLENYRLIFPRGVGNVIESENKNVFGCLYALTMDELYVLDSFEGYDENREISENIYIRKQIKVQDANNNFVFAYIYIQTIDSGFDDKPGSGYLRNIIQGAKECSLPQSYIDELEMIN
jgi:gamma-glutamylcyclotransferase (GGCT)/AIG2-like uncharacterized protein YtfP